MIGPGSAELSTSTVPTLEVSGQLAGSSVPKAASVSVHAVLPSAPLGLIDIPSGRVTTVSRICDGEGTKALWFWGTLSSTSMPEAVSASLVVGTPVRLGLNPSWSHPVVLAHGASATTSELS